MGLKMSNQKKPLPMNFFSIIGSQFFSNIGDCAYEIVFVILCITLSQANYFLVGCAYFVKFIPYLFFGPLGGAITDAYNKKHIMILSDIFRCLLTTILALFYFSFLNIYILMIFGFLHTFFRTLFQPAFQSTITSMLGKELLIKGNSISQISTQISSIIGPLVCALLIARWNKGIVIILDAITFAISCICIAKTNIPISGKDCSKKSIFDLYKNAFLTITQLPSSPILFVTFMYSATCIFLTSSLLRFILPAHILLITKQESYIGYAMSIIAIGSILGAFIFSRIHTKISNSDLLLYWMLYGATFLIISLSKNLYIVSVCLFLLGFVGVIVDIIIIHNIQTYSLENEIGKNFGIFSTSANTAEAFSNLISGIVNFIGFNLAFIIISTLLYLIPGYKYFMMKFRQMRN
jgi:MFS family permease